MGDGGGIPQILEHHLGHDYFFIIIFVGVDEKSFHISFVYAFIFGTCRCVNEMFTLSMPYIHLPR